MTSEEANESLLSELPSSSSNIVDHGPNAAKSRPEETARVTLHKPDLAILNDNHEKNLILIRLALCISIILYLADLAFDLKRAIDYNRNGDYFYYNMTVAFVIIPMVFNIIINFIHHNKWIIRPTLKRFKFLRATFVLLLPVSRYISRSMIYTSPISKTSINQVHRIYEIISMNYSLQVRQRIEENDRNL
jgi:hypothetical protein